MSHGIEMRPIVLLIATMIATDVASAQQQTGRGMRQGPPSRVLRLTSGPIDTRARAPETIDAAAVGRRERMVAQFSAPLTPADRADLVAAGVTLVQYIPDNAYIVSLAAPRAAIPHASWSGKFNRDWKRDPADKTRRFIGQQRQALAAAGNAGVVISLFADADAGEIESLMRIIAAMPGATVHYRSSINGAPTITATLRSADVDSITALPQVQFVEDAPELTERNVSTRGIVQSNNPLVTPLYDNGLTGLNQVLGIIDSRPDTNHCSFFDSNPIGPSHRKILAYNVALGFPATHGTHVAGIATGDAGDFSETRGVAYDAKFVFSTVPVYTEAAIMEVLGLHHSQGARIHTNSWGNDASTSYDSLARGVDSFSYNNEDDLVIYAATNTGNLRNPENSKNCLAVGASQDGPNQDYFCSGGIGPTSDGRRKPEIFAPGCSISSALVNSGCGTIQLTGTSMAAPAVAAAAILTRQYYTTGFYPSGAATPADAFTPSGSLIKATLLNATNDMTGITGYPSTQEGWGRLVADDALFFPGDARRLFVLDVRNAAGLSTGLSTEQSVVVQSGGQPLKVTLVWTDPPAAAGVAAPAINNLDLEAVAPDNTIYKGNVFVGGVSAPGGDADSINNVEQVQFTAPEAGTWTFRVNATAVNQGLQGFALVVTGDIETPGQPLQIFVTPPATTLIAPNALTNIDVTIRPGIDSIVPGTAALYYRAAPAASFKSTPLIPIGGDQYRATLPRFGCADAPEFYATVVAAAAGERRSPLAAPTVNFSAAVGTPLNTLILHENFESGLPPDWTASGLWHISSDCVQNPACDGVSWAYFGVDGTCTYDTGVRVQGDLVTAPISLPTVGPGGKLTLSFCSALGRESSTIFDLATVSVDATVLEQVSSNSTAWGTRTMDLTAFQGQTVTLKWRFDSVDSFVNNLLGWQVDNITITAYTQPCLGPEPCYCDITLDRQVNTADLTMLLDQFGTGVPPFSGADISGDGYVDTVDLTALLDQYGVICP